MLASLRHPGRILAVAVALGACADFLLYDRPLGISAPLFTALALAALAGLSLAERRLPERGNLWLTGSALFFAACLAWRASPTLTGLNTLALLGSLALLAVGYRSPALAAQPLPGLLGQLAAALSDMLFQPAALGLQAGRAGAGLTSRGAASARMVRPIGCGLLLALPALFVFTALLMSADSVFASYVEQLFNFELPFDLAQLFEHGLFIGAMAWLCAGGLLAGLLGNSFSAFGQAFGWLARAAVGLVYVDQAAALEERDIPAEGDTARLHMPQRALIAIGWVEALTVLVAVDLLFGSFMLIQGAYFFGGLSTLERSGMTYAEYARRGFFELLAVAWLALGLLCALAVVTRRAESRARRAFNAASALMIGLVLGLLISAFQRMSLYELAYGYTELRIYTHTFMVWLAVVLGLFLMALLLGRAQIFWFGGLLASLIYLAGLNLANPDAQIVRANVGRLGAPSAQGRYAGDQVDVFYLTELSADAIPPLVQALPKLDAESRAAAERWLAGQRDELRQQAEAGGWPGWHLGRAAALWAIDNQN